MRCRTDFAPIIRVFWGFYRVGSRCLLTGAGETDTLCSLISTWAAMNSYIARLLLCAWLHDPPDKALPIQGHEPRTLKYLGTIIDIDRQEIKLPAAPPGPRHGAVASSGPRRLPGNQSGRRRAE